MIETDYWDRHPSGEIETAPVIGFVLMDMPLNVMMRFEVLLETGQTGGVQMHIPATRAIELAEHLKSAAQRALSTPSDTPAQ